jgi:serine protease Do
MKSGKSRHLTRMRAWVTLLTAAGLLLPSARLGQVTAKTAPAATLTEFSRSIEELTTRVSSAVVQVFASGFRLNAEDESTPGLVMRTRSGGSGVLIDSEGHIVTNAHVVEGAARIEVLLPNVLNPDMPGRSILKARSKKIVAEVLGTDKETDLAVLKIPKPQLPHLELADSDGVRQGQIVLAVGSPMGLENSVTLGVVSATARQLRPEDPMIYIQTDCPINPGSSGGPLMDLQGRVVGINTFILSQSGGNEGIGFAAPSNIVRNVVDQIRRTGKVRRGTIGVYAQTISPELASGLGLPKDWGVILGDIVPGGQAAGAGLQEGDVVLTLDGKIMENARQFEVNVYRRAVGDSIVLEVQRGAQKLSFRVPVGVRDDASEQFTPGVSVHRDRVPVLGILGMTIDAKIAQSLPPLRKHAGVLVAARVSQAFPGEEQLLPGDVIYAVNNVKVASMEELRAATRDLTLDKPVVVQLERAGRVRFLAVSAEDAPAK